MDIAASIQQVTEEIILKLATSLKNEYKINNLCLAGGVALNCVANGKILKSKIFDKIWIQPAAGDAGASLGASLVFWHSYLNKERKINIEDDMKGSFLGPEYNQSQIEKELEEAGAKFRVLNYQELINKTVDLLIDNAAIGWFQGRMEFGPRALGGRSILGDPRSEKMQKNLNLKVKYRESFRPFAPAILREDLSEWFDMNTDSPYMLFVADINSNKKIEMTNDERSKIPAVTHVDYSSRIQTVTKNINKRFYDLIFKFKEKTKCPVLINTSFNVRGEPIVNTPKEAFNCFMGANLDYLVIGNCILDKSEQTITVDSNYKNNFILD
jgi:carbamoyltransferase